VLAAHSLLTAWKVEFKKHVFCSLMIPIGFRAVGNPSEFDLEAAAVSDTDPFLDGAWLEGSD